MTALIIEDDIRDKEILQTLLEKYLAAEITIKGHAANITDAYNLILTLKPDLVFLDVELGADTGFDLLSRFSTYPFSVIFVTAFDRYAIQAIKFNALDFILKPVEIGELLAAVKKASSRPVDHLAAELKNLLHNLKHPSHKSNMLAIPVATGYKMVCVQNIMYCEALQAYTNIYCANEPVLCSSVNLGEYEDLLAGYSFCRVHHSFVVNKDFVKNYNRGEGGELTLVNGATIPVSRRKKQEVIDWLTSLK